MVLTNSITVTDLQNIEILRDEPLANYTNTCTGGPADFLVFPKTAAELKLLCRWGKQENIPLTILGNASNLIVKDGGIRGLVIILTKMDQIQVNEQTVTAQAGAAMIATTQAACQAGLSGLEFAAGIPGSVGGAIFMNAGAYAGEIKDVVQEVLTVDFAGNEHVYRGSELDFGYRHSLIQEQQLIVVQATFQLQPKKESLIREQMDQLNFLRASKQPLEYPSCGSVFKRPKGYFTGKLIHDAGLQGYQVGGAQVSLKHAGFIVNRGGATATDYLQVIAHVQAVIKKQFDVVLETEVRILGA
ncbi:UDP-N-acetylenolpyruvoylglucosamine reductase [Ligilactobacillus salitolerans]|uniref:UDP-N-acetylenolpyruvoylglucosamine reductase n=1 Tax=Ligilactobacillus salitolerans TaxID=1808352 RepID=A0A401IUE8_9LACO|nr:UDP-N-acetylmuramate dehydrogenase [Ligilactobacillus salitolerans]GBG95135.1 UDP-N-acetylenolpyruvoylglucosamine reductase [Ligilactobacillus salitolerans]